MKKLLFIALLVGFVNFGNAQGVFKIGANVGLTAADASDISDVAIGADVYYYFANPDAFFNIGATAGFRNFFGKEFESGGESYDVDDAQFLPIAAAGRFTILSTLYAGADVGYAIGISDFLDGGFYLRPVVGIDIANAIEIFLAYDHISDAGDWGYLNAGILFEL